MSTTSALQATLAGEHAAVHLFGALGGVTSASEAPELHALLTAQHRTHRARREYLTTVLRGAGSVPTPAEPAYQLPGDLTSPDRIRASGLEVEQRCTETYARLVGESTDDVRDWAMTALAESAVALTRWGTEPEPFPGAPEL